jgi:SAM-dependent methyltransferase
VVTQKFMALVRAVGVTGTLRGLARRLVRPRLRCYSNLSASFEGKTGLEIGGPSVVFSKRGLLPIYTVADRIDNCTFSRQTVWEGTIVEGRTFVYDRDHAPGHQYISEASSLNRIASEFYDFILSAHTLEHLANPLGALSEWMRVLKTEGVVVLVMPHKDGTFDHRRPVTSLAHLVEDFERQTSEADLTHLEEILRLHDLARDPGGGDFATFRARSERNLDNRCLHHHVFDTPLAVELVHYLGLEIQAVEPVHHYHIFIVAQKVLHEPHNQLFRGEHAAYRRCSPFSGDRIQP